MLLPDPTRPQPLERRRRRHRGPRILRRLRRFVGHVHWLPLLIFVASLAAVAVVGSLVLATDANNRVQAAWASLSRVLNTLSSRPSTELTFTDFERLQLSVDELIGTLNGVERQVGFVRPVAALHADLATRFALLDIGQDLALAAGDTLRGLQPTLFFLTSGEAEASVVAQVSSGERVVELLRLGRGLSLSAADHLTAARAALDALDRAAISTDLLLTVEGMDAYLRQLEEINVILLAAPDLLTMALGLDAPRSYLVLAQNSDELRPSGGYISTFGWLTVRNARITAYDYSPTTPTSPNPPPAEYAEQLDIPGWWIHFGQPIYAAWDGSWYADFPSTAAMAAWFYNGGGNPQAPVDGVIAIDLAGFEMILQALGSVAVPGYDAIVTPENFRQMVYAIRAEGEGDLPHKRFLAALYRQILADWQAAGRERGAQLLGATLRALREKHMLLYFADDALNRAVDLLGWSGRQTAPAGHDYLMAADANLGNKSNRSITRQITYDVEIEPDGALHSRVTLTYDYPAQNDPAVQPAHYNDIDYHNLLQVFVPPGSTLVETSEGAVLPQSVTGENHTLFVALTEVAYNSGGRFQFSYTTPPLIEAFGPYRRYRLLLQKQPGTFGDAVSVQVALPPDARTVSASPAPVASYALERPILEFRVALGTDQWIEVIYTE